MEGLEDEFVQLLMDVGVNLGMDPLVVKLSGILFMSPEEVSLEELAEKTGYSLASVSNKMKLLEKTGNVRRIRKPKSKKEYYFVEKDALKLFRKKLELVHSEYIRPIEQRLPVIMEKYKNSRLNGSDRKKLQYIRGYHKQLVACHGMIDHFLKDAETIK
jgi:DNA-binding transcriptional regulator GbsR (MarR family)